jgi:hypothetical protein
MPCPVALGPVRTIIRRKPTSPRRARQNKPRQRAVALPLVGKRLKNPAVPVPSGRHRHCCHCSGVDLMRFFLNVGTDQVPSACSQHHYLRIVHCLPIASKARYSAHHQHGSFFYYGVTHGYRPKHRPGHLRMSFWTTGRQMRRRNCSTARRLQLIVWETTPCSLPIKSVVTCCDCDGSSFDREPMVGFAFASDKRIERWHR